MQYKPRHVIEYAALRSLAGFLNMIPYRAALATGWCVALLLRVTLRSRYNRAKARIRSVFGPGMTEQEVRRIAWDSLRNITFSTVEFIRTGRMTPRKVRALLDIAPAERVIRELTKGGRGAIIAVPHCGNWELAAIACHHVGIPVFSFAAAQRNPLSDRYINGQRRLPGIATIARGSSALREVLVRLKRGEVLAILPDVRMRTPDIATPFLGGTANIGSGMALFARMANVPILPAVLGRRGWTGHHATLSAPVHPDPSLDRDEDVRRMTHAVMAVFDEAIRRAPGQWFWFNSRWILDPL